MEIDLIFKIGAAGLIVAVVCQILNRVGREELAALCGLAGLIAVLMTVMGMVGEFFREVRAMFDLV